LFGYDKAWCEYPEWEIVPALFGYDLRVPADLTHIFTHTQEDMVEPSMLVAMAMRIFRPGKAALAITTDGGETETE
jgi:hypothetical protein